MNDLVAGHHILPDENLFIVDTAQPAVGYAFSTDRPDVAVTVLHLTGRRNHTEEVQELQIMLPLVLCADLVIETTDLMKEFAAKVSGPLSVDDLDE